MNAEKELAWAIEARTDILVQRVVEDYLLQRPDVAARYGEPGRKKCLEDAVYHLRYLSSALQMQRPGLFLDYAQWVRQLLAIHHIPTDELIEYLGAVKQTLLAEFATPHDQELILDYLDPTLVALRRAIPPVGTHLGGETETDHLAKRFLELILAGDRIEAARLIQDSVDHGTPVRDVYLNVFQPVQYEIGRLWHGGKITVAQEHLSTAVTQWVMSRLYPQMFTGKQAGGCVVAACVAGDLHEIGLRMVADLMEIDGWNTFYVGANAPTKAIVEMVAREEAQLLALSATMGFHLGPLEQTIALLRREPECEQVKVLVGGRPFLIDPTLVQSVGADAMAANAEDALLVAKTLIDD